MLYKFGITTLVLMTSLATGCSPVQYSSQDLDIADNWQANTVENGLEYNGVRVNGVRVNGVRVNGVRVNGVASAITSIVNGAIAAASDDLNFTFASAQLNGSQFDADGDDDTIIPFRIDRVEKRPDLGYDYYYVSNWNNATATWDWACGADPTGTYAPVNTQIPAIALSDTWNLVNGKNVIADPSKFTFGCINAAIGKCVWWGYKRWETKQECVGGSCKNQDMAFIHQACTRLVRGDYCGDGVAHTRNGTGLDVYDSFDIQTWTNMSGWDLEAEWRHDGAHCIHHTRWGKADPTADTQYPTDMAYIGAKCPSRLAANEAGCANPSASHFYKSYGINDAIDSRSFLRDDSVVH